MAESSSHILRSFDAFPKVPPSNQVRTKQGTLTSILMYIMLFFLIWVEVGGYLDGFIDYQFTVDDQIRKAVDLNLDIAVHMPCKYLQANVRDATQDHMLAAERLNFQGISSDIPDFFFSKKKDVATPKLEDVLANSLEARFSSEGQHINENMPCCRIFGTVPINRVRGDFYISVKGFGFANAGLANSMNFTHYISEFSVGTFYPYLDNPLDMTYQVTSIPRHTYHYKLNIIPTLYAKLGLAIDTTQYAMSMYETSDRYMPGIFIQYDFEPIKMIVAERRLSFWHFFVRLVTIIGAIWIVTKLAYRGLEKLATLILGKEFMRRGEEKREGGLLDEEFEKI